MEPIAPASMCAQCVEQTTHGRETTEHYQAIHAKRRHTRYAQIAQPESHPPNQSHTQLRTVHAHSVYPIDQQSIAASNCNISVQNRIHTTRIEYQSNCNISVQNRMYTTRKTRKTNIQIATKYTNAPLHTLTSATSACTDPN